MVEIIPNWHPIWVHFAIALLITSSVIFVLFGWKPNQTGSLFHAVIVARWTLWIGVVAASGALLTGYWASGSVAHDDLAHANMMVHRTWAFIAASIYALAAVVEFVKRDALQVSVFSLFLMLAGGLVLTVTGLEGAENVYEHGLGVQRLPDISVHEHENSGHDESQEHETEIGESHDHEQVSEPGEKEADVKATGSEHSHSHTGAGAVSTPGNVEPSDHPASQVAARLNEAIAAGNVDTLRELLAPNVLIFESGGVESSLAEYEGHHMPADMAFMKMMDREMLFRRVFDAGDSATIVTHSRVHGMYKEQEIDLSSTETLVLKNFDGHWKVVHIHWSAN